MYAFNLSLIEKWAKQQVTALCLLDLSDVFNTVGYSIFLHLLFSWFGIKHTALSWIKSYLSFRSFCVNINGAVSSSFLLFYGATLGSVLVALLFILYISLVSTVISNSAVNHHLYADDAQLYISFPLLLLMPIYLIQSGVFPLSLTGWPQNFLLIIHLKLNSCVFGFLSSCLQ